MSGMHYSIVAKIWADHLFHYFNILKFANVEMKGRNTQETKNEIVTGKTEETITKKK